MSVRHQTRLYNTKGQLQAVFDSWRSLQVQRKINTFSECIFELDKNKDNRWQLFNTDSFVEVLRNNTQFGIPWTREYIGFHRTPKQSLTEAGNSIFTSYGRSLEDLLSRRFIAYQTGAGEVQNGVFVDFTHKIGAGDNVMKAFVRENIGSSANNVNRFRDGTMVNFQVAPDTTQAPLWDGERSFKNLRETIIEISGAVGVDFNVGLVTLDPPTFIFNTYFPLLGVDRTQTNPPVVLSPSYQNVRSVDYTVSRTDEINVAIVLGDVATFVPNPDPNKPASLVGIRNVYRARTVEADASPWNDIEFIKDARSSDNQQALQNVANELFATLGPRESFVVVPLANSNVQYGRDFFFGDKILVKYGDVTRVKKVVGVGINSSGDGGEDLKLELADVAATPSLLDVFRNIANRLSSVEHQGDL